MTRTRILAAAVAFVGVALIGMASAAADERSDGFVSGVTKAMDRALVLAVDVPRTPEPITEVEESVAPTRDTAVVVFDHPVLDDIAAEENGSAPPFCLTCPVMPVMPEPTLPPVPVPTGWTWDVGTFTVTNLDVSIGIRVSASYGALQSPLLPSTVLMPGQSVTIPAAPCGETVRVFVDNGARPGFTFC